MTLIRRTLALDLLIFSAAVAGWAAVDVVAVEALVACTLVCALVCQLRVQRALIPVRRWLRHGEQAPDELLRAADDAVQRLLARFPGLYGASWASALTAALISTLMMPELGKVPVRSDYLVFGCGVLATLGLPFAFMQALVASSADDTLVQLSHALEQRGLSGHRRPRPYARTLHRFALAFTLGMLFAALAIGVKAQAMAEREQVRATALAQVSLAAADLRARPGTVELAEGLRLVEARELPELLRERDEPELRSDFDPANGDVIAAARAGPERWVAIQLPAEQQLRKFVILVLILILALGGAGHIAATAIGQSLTQPLAELGAATRSLAASGDLRALERVVARHDDEVGALIEDFNVMLDMLSELVAAAEAVAVGELDVELEREGELHTAFATMTTQLGRMVTQMRVSATEISNASAELLAHTGAQQSAGEQLKEEATRASHSARSLAHAAEEIDEAARQVLGYAERSRETIDTVSARIRELDERAAGIAELLEQISEIAERSDLLALNGALEATRAGELGRGFALVAAEMRRLAERVTGTVEDVRAQIDGIVATGSLTVDAIGESHRLAEQTAHAARDISRLTETQRADTRRASTTAEVVASFVAESSAGVSQSAATVAGLREQARELEKLTGSFSA